MSEQAQVSSVKNVEFHYRGIIQKLLAKKTCRDILLAARSEGKVGVTYGRYGDAPERDGVPSKYFSVMAGHDQELEAELTKYAADNVNISIVPDDTMIKGVEPWAWHGILPIHQALKENGFMIVVSNRSPQELLKHIAKRDRPYKLCIIRGEASFAGLWVYNDDLTEERVLGAIAKVAPEIYTINALEKLFADRSHAEQRMAAARDAYDNCLVMEVGPGMGSDWYHPEIIKPKWWEMPEGIMVPGVPYGQRNPQFKRWTNRTVRPIVDFDKCIKCTLCWIECPDGAFDVTKDGYYPVNYEYCSGCGICSRVCPIKGCIEMVDELVFPDLNEHYGSWKSNREEYSKWIRQKKEEAGMVV